MKKTYTILFLLITILAFAQNKSVENVSKGKYQFVQVGDKIEVKKGDASGIEGNNKSRYSYREDEKSGTIEIIRNNNGINLPPPSSFSSPNEVKITQDAAGNRYWSIIDGTIVKVELVSDSPSSNSKQTEGN